MASVWQPWQPHQAAASEEVPKVDAAWLRVASDAANFARFLLDNHPDAIASPTKSRLYKAVARFDAAHRRSGLLLRYRTNASAAELKAGLTEVDRARTEGARQVAAALSELPGLTRWTHTAGKQLDITVPFGDTLLVVHRPGTPQAPPLFETRQIDCSDESASSIDFPEGGFFGAVVLNNIPSGTARRSLTLRSGAGELALQIRTSIPPTHPKRFRVLMRRIAPLMSVRFTCSILPMQRYRHQH